MAASEVMLGAPQWGADEWVRWLRRGPDDQRPSWQGLNDAADAIEAELRRLRARAERFSGPSDGA